MVERPLEWQRTGWGFNGQRRRRGQQQHEERGGGFGGGTSVQDLEGFSKEEEEGNVSNYSLRPTPGAERTPKVGIIPASQEETGKTESVLGLFQEMAYDELFSFPHDEESTNHLCSISGNFPMPEIEVRGRPHCEWVVGRRSGSQMNSRIRGKREGKGCNWSLLPPPPLIVAQRQ